MRADLARNLATPLPAPLTLHTGRSSASVKATASRLRETLSNADGDDAGGDVEGELPALVAHLSRAAAGAGFSLEPTRAPTDAGGVLVYRLLALGVVLSVHVRTRDVRVRCSTPHPTPTPGTGVHAPRLMPSSPRPSAPGGYSADRDLHRGAVCRYEAVCVVARAA